MVSDNFPYIESVVANFGRGNSPILPFSVQCSIDDTTLSDCTTTDSIDIDQCPHLAGVICEG